VNRTSVTGHSSESHDFAGAPCALAGRKRQALAIGLGATLIYLAFLAPDIYSIDGRSMLAVAESLVARHSTAIVSPLLGMTGRGGAIYSTWYPLLSFLAVPFVAAGMLAAHALHLPAHYVDAACAQLLSALISGATLAFVWGIAREIGASARGAWLAAVSYGFATIALVYARTFYAEPLLSFLTAAALYFAIAGSARASRRPIWLWALWLCAIFSALAILAKPTGIVVGPVLAAYLFAKRRPAVEAALPALGAFAGLALYGLYNFAHFGNPLTFGPAYQFSLANIPAGFAGLLASPGHGLIWYCPPAILAIFAMCRAMKSARYEALAIAGIFLGFLLLHSLWKEWGAGWSWGPRYLLPALPGAMALTGLLEKKWAKALAALAVAGFLVNAPNLVSNYERYLAEANEAGISEQALRWSPAAAPLVHAWGAAARQIRDARSQDVRAMFHESVNPATTIATSRALRIVDVWWWMLPAAGIPRWWGALVALLMILAGAHLLWHARDA
jgi:Dolichyl-phosphate-mannose-protein mannosyltransferase